MIENNNQFRKQEFEKRRVFKKGTSLCNAYSCPIFQNCLLEIKQLQQENARLKDKIEKAINFVDKYMDEWDFQDEVWKDMNDLLILLKEN